MAIAGLVVDQGLSKCIEAMSKGGWKIYPYAFAISDELGELETYRKYDTMNPTWFTGEISGRVVINVHTIEFLCTIPPQSADSSQYIREVYIISLDEAGKPFLLALGQSRGDAVYDPSGSTKLRIQISIQNINMVDLFVFKYTQAQEIYDHNYDPNAHPDIRDQLDKILEKHDVDPNAHPYILEVTNNIQKEVDHLTEVVSTTAGILIPDVRLYLGDQVHVIRTTQQEVTNTDQYVVNRDAKGSLCRVIEAPDNVASTTLPPAEV